MNAFSDFKIRVDECAKAGEGKEDEMPLDEGCDV